MLVKKIKKQSMSNCCFPQACPKTVETFLKIGGSKTSSLKSSSFQGDLYHLVVDILEMCRSALDYCKGQRMQCHLVGR